MKKVKPVLSVAMSIVLFLGLAGCGKSDAGTGSNSAGVSAKEVRIATQPSPFGASLFVAKAKGYLEDELKQYGVKISYTSFAAGPPMNEAFAAGKQDIGIIGDLPLILAKASGQKRVTFAKAASGEQTQAVVVRPDSDIKSAADLKGKKVAVVKGSYAHHLLARVLEGVGLTLNDIELVNLPVADINNAVDQKQVEAGVVWEPALIKGLNNNQVKILADGTGIKSNNIFYFAATDFAGKNPAILEAYIKALQRATDFIRSNPEEAAEIIAKDVNLSKDEIIKLFTKYNYTPAISGRDIEELKVVEAFCREQKLSTNSVSIDELVNTDYLKNAGVSE